MILSLAHRGSKRDALQQDDAEEQPQELQHVCLCFRTRWWRLSSRLLHGVRRWRSSSLLRPPALRPTC